MENHVQRKSFFPGIILVLLAWVIYTAIYLYYSKNPHTAEISGFLALIGQVGLDMVAGFLCFFQWRRAATPKTRRVYGLLLISFICAFLADGIYNILLNVEDMVAISNWQDSLFDIPFAFFLLFQNLAWIMIFSINGTEGKPIVFFDYLPYTLAAIVIFLGFMYGIHWKISYFSTLGFYQILDTGLEMIGFVMAAFCLARASSQWLRYLAMGYLCIIATDLLIRYNVVEQLSVNFNPFETTWVLGLLLMVYSFFFLKKRCDR